MRGFGIKKKIEGMHNKITTFFVFKKIYHLFSKLLPFFFERIQNYNLFNKNKNNTVLSID